jgi:hypothetical protein
VTTECGLADHSWADSTDGTSLHQIATMKCRRCGVGHAIELRAVGTRTMQVDMKMFPARGSHTVSPDMMLFFMASWGKTCQEIEGDGYTVVRGTPEIALPQRMKTDPQGATRQPGRSGWGAFWAISAIAVIAVVTFVVIKLHSGSGTPGGVAASSINEYTIRVSWTDGSKDVTGFNIDNGCPVGACGDHGATLAKTTGPITSTVFHVTPGTYQCFRVQAILKAGVSGWSGYGCATTPSLLISGTQAWTRTDVILVPGDQLNILAAGLMSVGSSSQVDPTGEPSCTPAADDAAASSFPAPHLPCLSLIAEIGGGPPFEVGTSAVVITGRGRLYLGVNASNFSGSSGSWTVNMKIGGAPPSP